MRSETVDTTGYAGPERFIGRREELRLLEEAYRTPGSAFIPIYGRRRVGKSELILRFMSERPGVYFVGKQAPAALQIRELLREASAALREPLLAGVAADDWKTALQAISKVGPVGQKRILALDEFQWTAAASPELPSVLQELWDRQWKRSGDTLLILCGSYVGFMEREVMGRQSPLFGRRTAQILLRPFGYREAAEFHPGYSLVDRAKTYFLCGGVPLYLRYFSQRRSVEGNVVATLLSEFAPLYREPDFLLREERRDLENYTGVLVALAAGFTTYRAIARQTGIDERALHYYLHQLQQLGYIIRRYPLSGRCPAPRQVRYELADPLLRFWFRFVYPNTSFISQMGAERALKDRIRPDLEAYFGSCFERLCREALPVLYLRAGVTAGFEVGEYWDQTTQIDVVGLREDGWTDLGECRWGMVRGLGPLAAELEGKVGRFPNPRNATIGRRLFLRNAPPRSSRPPADVRVHALEELYAQ